MQQLFSAVSSASVKTMSSIEIVKLINDMREEGSAILRHSDFTNKVLKVLGEEPAKRFVGQYKAGNGQMQPCYHLPKRETNLMVMSENPRVQAAVYDRMEVLEKAIIATSSNLSFADSLAGAEVMARMLNMSESSKLTLVSGVMKVKAPELLHLVPVYAIDAPNATDVSSRLTFSATVLLAEHGKPMTAQKFNIIAVERGYLTEESRPSTTKGIKLFKCLTDKGLAYGKNMTSPNNQRETAPHYYADKFDELLVLLGSK